MRVLAAHNRYRSAAPSGENRVVDEEIHHLRGAGIDVVPMIEESDRLDAAGFRQMADAAVGPVYSFAGMRRFDGLVRQTKPDLVHLHNVFPLISPQIIRKAKEYGLAVVQTVHNYRHTCVKGVHFRD